MYEIRRTEITLDTEYKARNIRGFLHLYDGQEAIAIGLEGALTHEDSLITSYRCHGHALVRGHTPRSVFAELFGLAEVSVGHSLDTSGYPEKFILSVSLCV
jgi:pyruvate dehydrogenase E1 component alpha subunit